MNKKKQSMLGRIFGGATNIASQATKEVLVGKKATNRKSVRKTTSEGILSIFTG